MPVKSTTRLAAAFLLFVLTQSHAQDRFEKVDRQFFVKFSCAFQR
jgi:hypothetical protein